MIQIFEELQPPRPYTSMRTQCPRCSAHSSHCLAPGSASEHSHSVPQEAHVIRANRNSIIYTLRIISKPEIVVMPSLPRKVPSCQTLLPFHLPQGSSDKQVRVLQNNHFCCHLRVTLCWRAGEPSSVPPHPNCSRSLILRATFCSGPRSVQRLKP